MKTMSTTPDTISLLADADYRRQAEKLGDLRARHEALDRRRGELLVGLNRVVEHDRLTERAQALLTDDVTPRPDDAALRRALGDVEDEIRVLTRAVELQQRVVDSERARVSAAICARLRPQHRAIVRRIAAAVTELSEALTAEQDLRLALRDAEVVFAAELRPMPLPAAGVLTDPNSALSRWMADAREHRLA
jgi:hypothetical protein